MRKEGQPLPFINYLPKPARYLCGTLGFALISACGQGAPQERNGHSPGSQPTAGDLLDLPFPPDPNMKIQQGFLYLDDTFHKGVDYIKGQLDRSETWQSFPVLAAADGLACLPPDRKDSNAVYIQHKIENQPEIRSYYGHLATQPDLPPCSQGFKIPYKKGQQIAYSGATGAIDEQGRPLTHLHFQVNIGLNDGSEIAFDPYALMATRGAYPDPNFTNGKTCGPDALLAKCFQKAAGGAVIAAPKPTQRTQTDRITAATVVPTERRESLTINQQAQVVTMQQWLNALKVQEQTGPYSKGFYQTLDKEIAFMASVSGRPFTPEDIILQKVPSNNVLMRISWKLTNTYPGVYAGFRMGGYFNGESEIKGVIVKESPYELSRVDIANGFSLNEGVSLTFLIRQRGNYSPDSMPPPPGPNISWTPWKEMSRSWNISILNNQWQVKQSWQGSPIDMSFARSRCTSTCALDPRW